MRHTNDVAIADTVRMIKDSGLRIRVERDLREQFLQVCRAQDRPAAQVIREFMRNYIDRHAVPTSGSAANDPLE